MEVDKCMKCGKVIEGYTEDHVAQLMLQHNFKHQREEKTAQQLINELEDDVRGFKK
jgi:hypothetical protein